MPQGTPPAFEAAIMRAQIKRRDAEKARLEEERHYLIEVASARAGHTKNCGCDATECALGAALKEAGLLKAKKPGLAQRRRFEAGKSACIPDVNS